MDEPTLIEKIQSLPPDKVAEVEHFVDFLRQRLQDLSLTRAAATLSKPVFEKVWDNPEYADYDRL